MDLLQTGNIIYASETSEESGKSHSTGAVIRVSDATVDVTAGVTLIKPEHFARQEIRLIRNGQFDAYPESDYEVVNLGYTKSDPNWGEWDLIGNFVNNVHIEYNEYLSAVRFPIAGSGHDSTFRPGAYVLTKKIDFTNIKKMSMKFYAFRNGNSEGLDSTLQQSFKICVFTSRNKFKDYYKTYWIDSWDNTNVLKAAIRNTTTLTGDDMDTNNLFFNGPYLLETENLNLTGEYYIQIAGGGWGDNWYLLITDLTLHY